jgi:hypothetical protein
MLAKFNLSRLGFIRKFRPKRFHWFDPRSATSSARKLSTRNAKWFTGDRKFWKFGLQVTQKFCKFGLQVNQNFASLRHRLLLCPIDMGTFVQSGYCCYHTSYISKDLPSVGHIDIKTSANF